MRRYNTISTLGECELVETKDVVQVVGAYVVDDSSFVPLSEAVKNVSSGAISPQVAKSLYDFPDGKDDGSKVPVDRTHEFKGDIAEVSVIQQQSSAKVKYAYSEYLKDKELDDRLTAINNGQINSDSPKSE